MKRKKKIRKVFSGDKLQRRLVVLTADLLERQLLYYGRMDTIFAHAKVKSILQQLRKPPGY